MSDASDALAAAAQVMMEALRGAASDPADAIRLLATFVADIGQPPAAISDVGVLATAALFRRSAMVSIALATADYQPASSTDANAVIDQVAALLDAEIVIAADAGDDASFSALRDVRQAVVADLRARSATLPELITAKFGAPVPSLAAAYALYGDCTREPEMVARADVEHPGFMPTSFEALAS